MMTIQMLRMVQVENTSSKFGEGLPSSQKALTIQLPAIQANPANPRKVQFSMMLVIQITTSKHNQKVNTNFTNPSHNPTMIHPANYPHSKLFSCQFRNLHRLLESWMSMEKTESWDNCLLLLLRGIWEHASISFQNGSLFCLFGRPDVGKIICIGCFALNVAISFTFLAIS